MPRISMWMLSLAAAAGAGWLLASVVPPVAQPARQPRFPALSDADLTEQQRPLAERIKRISSVGIGGPYNPLLRSPPLTQKMLDLLDYLRWNSSLPPRLSEFAILIQGRLWRSQVEWFAHEPLALKAGLRPEIVADLKAKRRPRDMKPDEAAVYDLSMELATKHVLSDETFLHARSLLNDQQIVDLVGLSGTYVTVAMLLATGDEGVPPGKEPPFKPGEP